MSRLNFTTREIGTVSIFDLLGEPTSQDSIQEVAWRIQKNIRRHRLQRVILNVQKIKFLDELGLRKLVAAFLRPQRSLIYGATGSVKQLLEGTYLPNNMKVCLSEREVAEDLGSFLFHKDEMGKVLGEGDRPDEGVGVGQDVERRRSKRMHVAIPLEMKIHRQEGEPISTSAIATNISQGGVYLEYLDLDALEAVEALNPFEGLKVEIQIHPSGNFPEEYHLEGFIRRKELRKRGLGLAVEFAPPNVG